jgi:hypothetical protein
MLPALSSVRRRMWHIYIRIGWRMQVSWMCEKKYTRYGTCFYSNA